MTASLDEAFGLLSKWKKESVPIKGLLVSSGVSVEFGGLIKDLAPDGLVITQYAKPGQKVSQIRIGLTSALWFEYGDTREQGISDPFTGKITSVLVLHLPDGMCTLYGGE